MTLDAIEDELAHLLAVPLDTGQSSLVGSHRRPRVEALQHFQASASLTLGCPAVARIMHDFVPRTAWSTSYLMHMVVAIACAHWKRHLTDESYRRDLNLAEIESWSLALQLYRDRLAMSSVEEDDGDALIATTVLAICYTFALDDDVPVDAMVHDNEQMPTQLLDPLAATAGFRALFYLLGSTPPRGHWTEILCATDDEQHTFTYEQPGISGIPRAFVELCELDQNSSPTNHPYHRMVRLLTPLLHLQPNVHNFNRLFAYCGRTWENYKPLLTRRDARALLLISYWFALLRQIDQWWLTTRAKSECLAIVSYLHDLYMPDIDALLPYPAAFSHSNAGYMWSLLDGILADTC